MVAYLASLFALTFGLLNAVPAIAVTGCSCAGQTYSSSASIGSYPAGTKFVSDVRDSNHEMLLIIERSIFRLETVWPNCYFQRQQRLVSYGCVYHLCGAVADISAAS
jgi:hypothetical protein